eukprot:5352777-Amphidinium_carterae.1
MSSSSPAGVKAHFKGPPKGHPDYQEVVPITYLPYTPKAGTGKSPPPELPVERLFKPPPAPGYGGLSREDHAIAQEIYARELANRKARANRRRDDEDDDHRYYNTGRQEPNQETELRRCQGRMKGKVLTHLAEVEQTRCQLSMVTPQSGVDQHLPHTSPCPRPRESI